MVKTENKETVSTCEKSAHTDFVENQSFKKQVQKLRKMLESKKKTADKQKEKIIDLS